MATDKSADTSALFATLATHLTQPTPHEPATASTVPQIDIRPLPVFVPSVVREQVEADLGALRNGEHFALIAGLDLTGARMAIVARSGKHWTFSGYTSHEWKGGNELGAKIVFAI